MNFRPVVPALVLAVAVTGCSTTATTTPVVSAVANVTPSLPAVTVPAGQAAVLQQAFVDVVKKVGPSVVQIETTEGLGSGIIYDTAGHIVTNAHVVGNAHSFTVTFADGKIRPATLVGTFPAGDLAVIKVEAAGLAAAHFADSDTLEVGDIVMAIGNPLGLRSSVSEGIVSATHRTVPEGNGTTLPSTIQTSAAINPGNSGGALVDLNGDVVGIPTLAALDPQLGGAAVGIGFAIPSNTVTDIASQLIKDGRVTNSHRAYLGITGATRQGGGVIVSSVEPGGPASKAGIAAGDIITNVNGHDLAVIGDLSEILASLKPGASMSVSVTHQDATKATVNVTLGELPAG